MSQIWMAMLDENSCEGFLIGRENWKTVYVTGGRTDFDGAARVARAVASDQSRIDIVDQENSIEVIIVKRMYTICMFQTCNSGFLQLYPGVLIRSNSVEPSIGR